jgi:hypothetical protein
MTSKRVIESCGAKYMNQIYSLEKNSEVKRFQFERTYQENKQGQITLGFCSYLGVPQTAIELLISCPLYDQKADTLCI